MLPRLEHALQSVLVTQTSVRLAYLFGSVARGTATASSDVDVAVLPADGVDLDELTAALERAAGRRVDLVDLRRASPLLLREVVRDGVVVLCRDEDERAAFEVRAQSTFLDTQHLRDVQHAYLHERAQAPHGSAR